MDFEAESDFQDYQVPGVQFWPKLDITHEKLLRNAPLRKEKTQQLTADGSNEDTEQQGQDHSSQ
jgi:hypothetical protein